MYEKIALELDKVADSLEAKGLTKEAAELDIVANTLEKIAYTRKTLGIFNQGLPNISKNILEILSFIESGNNSGVKDKQSKSLTILDNIIEHFNLVKKNLFKGESDPEIENILRGLDLVKKDMEALDLDKLKVMQPRLDKFKELWEKVEPKINAKQHSNK